MEKFLKNRRFFNILLLIFLVGFLVLPKTCLADEFENIDLEKMGKYLELPRGDAQKLIDTLRQVLTTEGIFLWSSGYVTDEKTAAGVILLNVVRVEILNHLLVDVPIEITWGIVKGAVEMSRIFLDSQGVSIVLNKFEKETVKRATEYGMNFLLENEIRVTPGAIKFKYSSNYGGEKEVIFQYVMIYKPIDAKSGLAEIRFYSPNPIEPPNPNKFSKFLQVPNLQKNLPPFIVKINGTVKKNEFGNYRWVDENGILVHPSVSIDFPPTVPDLGVRPLSTWEKYVLKPIESRIKEVEVIITKVTGKSPGLVDIWGEIKKFISKLKSLAPAGLVETQTTNLTNSRQSGLEEPNIINQQSEEFSAGDLVEAEPQPIESEPEISVAGLQEMLDDITERADVLNQQVTELVEARPQEVEKYETEKEVEEIEEIKEIEEMEEIEDFEALELEEESLKTDEKDIILCERISQPIRNKVIFNEIAWMGTEISANHEWIELKNISYSQIDLTGWQILNKEKKIKIIFPEKYRGATPVISTGGFWLLERTSDESVPGVRADLIYTGALRNSDEALYLFDENCQLQDEVLANPDWSAGDNSSKRTMERKTDLTWQTGASPGGTTKSENSSGYYAFSGGGGAPPPPPAPAPSSSPPKILISEVQIESASSSDDEFIELYNPNNEEIDISQWSIQKSYSTSTTIYKKNFETGDKIPAKGYFLIVYASSTNQNLLNLADLIHKTFSLAKDNTVYLAANQEKIESASDADIVDMVGFGENVFSEGNPAPNPQTGKSSGREWSTTTENYIDNNDNQNDFEIQNPTPKAQNQSSAPTQNQSPIVQFIYSPANPIVNQEILFDASSSADSDGTITSYIWDFGDTNSTTSNQATTTHSYSTSTNFIVSLQVIDNNGATSFATTTINVIEPRIATGMVITEVQISDDEFVELYNPAESNIDISDWYFSYFSSARDWNNPWRNKKFSETGTTTIISARGYFLIGLKGYPETNGNPNVDWQVYQSEQLSNTAGAVGIFSCNPEVATSSTTTLAEAIDQAKSCEIDLFGWRKEGVADLIVFEGNPFSFKQNEMDGKSFQRKKNQADLYFDNDDNLIDFKIVSPTPTNSKGESGNILPPVKINDLSVAQIDDFTIQLTWSAPFDLDTPYTNLSYEIRHLRNAAIAEENWASSTQIKNPPSVAEVSNTQIFTISDLNYQTFYSFAIKTFDGRNYSFLSNVVFYQTLPASTSSPWSMFRGNPQHTGQSPFAGPGVSPNPKFGVLIETQFPDDQSYFWSPVIGADGLIYFTHSFEENGENQKGGLYAFYPNGQEKWVYPLPWVTTSPALGPDGALYLVLLTNEPSLLAVNRNGTKKWEKSLTGLSPKKNLTIAADGTIYLQTYSNLIVLNPDNGEIKWEFETSETDSDNNICPAVDQEGNIYLAHNQALFAFDSNGNKKWQRDFDHQVKTPSIGLDGTIYLIEARVRFGENLLNCLYAINPEESKDKWDNPKCDFHGLGPPLISSEGNIFIAGGYNPSGTWITVIYGYDNQGKPLENWQYRQEAVGTVDLLLIDREGIIYADFGGTTIKALNTNGQEIWSKYLVEPGKDNIVDSISLSREGVIYLPGSKKIYSVAP